MSTHHNINREIPGEIIRLTTVDGEPLRGGEGEGVAVAQADVAVPVEDVVMTERDVAPAAGGVSFDEHARLAAAGMFRYFEGVDDDDIAVIELFLPVGRADAKALARRDVERHGVPAGLASADGNRYRLLERRRVELTQAQALGKRLALGVGSNERGAGFAGVLALITGPVVGEAFERCLFAPAEMHMAARMVSGYRVARLAIPEGLRSGDLPGLKVGFIGHCLVVSHIVGEKLDAILAALDDGMSKAAVCRNFGVKRTTLIETLARIDTAPSSGASSP